MEVTDKDDEQPAAAVAQAAAKAPSKAKAALLEAQGLSREERMAALDKAGTKDKRRKMKDQAMNQINSKFADIRKAFHYMDVNGSGKVGKGEIKRAMHMWNLDMADEDLELLLSLLLLGRPISGPLGATGGTPEWPAPWRSSSSTTTLAREGSVSCKASSEARPCCSSQRSSHSDFSVTSCPCTL